jgi:hypothetical protein
MKGISAMSTANGFRERPAFGAQRMPREIADDRMTPDA